MAEADGNAAPALSDGVILEDQLTATATATTTTTASPATPEPGRRPGRRTPSLPGSGTRSSTRHQVAHLREPIGYRLKKRLLGTPLHSERLEHETLGKPTALAVFASDCISSCAYATEEIMRVMFVGVGMLAFTLVTPITIALLVVLGFLILSYRQTIKAYPSAGGAYIVTRDNFGVLPAQVAGVALLTDYILTVAVSIAAGTTALASAFPALERYHLIISISFVALIAYGNLRGTKESGKLFAVPTYFFIVNMLLMIGVGMVRYVQGSLHHNATNLPGMLTPDAVAHSGWVGGAAILLVLKAFGSGGSAVTGVEAISNGVPAFRKPAWRNASDTLVVMGVLLGVMFLGLSFLTSKVHAVPYADEVPSVLSQVAKLVYGTGPFGHLLYLLLQSGTMLILVLAANTSFADFPRLASFHAGDNFMPRQLRIRGHRLVFSNGIVFLAGAGIATLIATNGKVSRLIPLYAIGVFTSFTLSQAGMAKHHLTHREPKWRTGLAINATGAVLSFIVLMIVASMKFMEGAWVIILLVPVLVFGLMRLNKAYAAEAVELLDNAAVLAVVPTRRKHSVLVLVDALDAAAARAMQYARTLDHYDLRAVHFDIDPWTTKQLTDSWAELGLARFPLDILECPDRRVARAALELADQVTADGSTELTVLIPRREYRKAWHRILHDRSSNPIAAALSGLAHCNVTIVPYHLGTTVAADLPVDGAHPTVATPAPDESAARRAKGFGRPSATLDPSVLPANRTRVIDVTTRDRVTLHGRVRAMRVQPWAGNPALECSLADETGSVSLIFLGRREIAGVRLGTVMSATGVVGEHHGRRGMLNPSIELISAPPEPAAPMH